MRDALLVFITGNIAGLILALQHYAVLPLWARVIGKPMPTLARYSAGTINIVCAACFLFFKWQTIQASDAMMALVVITVCAGAWTVACYTLDDAIAYFDELRSRPHGQTDRS